MTGRNLSLSELSEIKTGEMAEHLINTINRQDIKMVNLFSVLKGVRNELIRPLQDLCRGINFSRCRYCVSSAFSHFKYYFGQHIP